MMMYRHGDVLLIRRGDCPAAPGNTATQKQIVLAEGEVTGHAHLLTAIAASYEPPSLLDRIADEDIGLLDRILRLPVGGVLTHQEHHTIALPPGLYEVRRQRTWAQASWLTVTD